MIDRMIDRIEFAKRMREAEDKNLAFNDENMAEAMGFYRRHGIDVYLWDNLADLIDPTCHNAKFSGVNGFTCSECGEWCPEEPDYCPSCGRRILWKEDRC